MAISTPITEKEFLANLEDIWSPEDRYEKIAPFIDLRDRVGELTTVISGRRPLGLTTRQKYPEGTVEVLEKYVTIYKLEVTIEDGFLSFRNWKGEPQEYKTVERWVVARQGYEKQVLGLLRNGMFREDPYYHQIMGQLCYYREDLVREFCERDQAHYDPTLDVMAASSDSNTSAGDSSRIRSIFAPRD